jgi:hypothetical protein
VFDFAQQKRKGREGKGRTYLVGRRSKGGVTPLSSPLGKKAAERERERGERSILWKVIRA